MIGKERNTLTKSAVFFGLVVSAALSAGVTFAPTLAVPAASHVESSARDAQAQEDTASAAHELTRDDLEAFLDGLIPAQIEREDIAGGVIAVVKDGKILLAKGYGYSDRANGLRATPGGTLFRIGSISKLFTWTAVMQLAEQDKLDLDRDVNDYLDFRVPPLFCRPVTLRNLLTHTSGFEETFRDESVSDAKGLFPLGDYLKDHLPARIFCPGVLPAYSNYGAALAAYIVERVSGKPFAHYAAENIFEPLGMQRTTFAQPLPDELKPLLSKGYSRAQDEPQPFEFVEVFPAGSASSTAEDMCNFMIAHLENGQFAGVQVLRPETAKRMHSRIFGFDDRMNGVAHGFYEESANGHPIIGHAGDTELFHSDLHLILDSHVGLFVSFNSAGKGEVDVRRILFERFLDRYFPPARASARRGHAQPDTSRLTGFYISSRRFENSFLKVTDLLEQSRVFANSDGTISVDSEREPNGELKKFEEISPLLYRDTRGPALLAFRRDASGRMQFQLDWPVFIYQRVDWSVSKYFNYGTVIFGLGTLGFSILWWPMGSFVRRRSGRALERSFPERTARLFVRFVCILWLVYFAAWGYLISRIEEPAWVNTLPPFVVGLGICGVVCTAGTILTCAAVGRNLMQRNGSVWMRRHQALVCIACLCLVWFAISWKLMNFSIHY